MFLPLAAFFRGGVTPTVTVTGATLGVAAAEGPVTNGVRFNLDGTVDENDDGSYAQINTSTDWIIPNGFGGSGLYEIRFTALTGTINTTDGTEDEWVTLSQNIEYSVTRVDLAGPGTTSATFTVEIRKDGGATLDSGTYELNATITA